MAGILYLVGTPIGNIGDMSPRAAATLAEADFIAAEDTRVTGRLLKLCGITKKAPLVSYYEQNEAVRREEIAARILSGETCALVTDAGMPVISDPGEMLVRHCAEAGIEVRAVPGPTAFATALAISGLGGRRFSFEGFLSVNKRQRTEHLRSLESYPNTMIFYEAPHKLRRTLSDLLECFGDRAAVLCREITKLYEEAERGTLRELAALYETKPPKGEYVIVVSGKGGESGGESEVSPEESLNRAAARAKELQESGYSAPEAAKAAAKEFGCRKADVYRRLIEKNT
ncbi:ribosomal RNA small subunit methyltransferase I [Clostridia bacterium]|nr:ribosomal RNA small subunit methyltransferase I [Clostridia bacterium]